MTMAGKFETHPRYLSRLQLNLRDRRVRQDMGNSQAFHRRLLDAFRGETSRAAIQLLYRIEARRVGGAPEYIALVQSRMRPDWSVLGEGYLQDTSHAYGWSQSGSADVKDVSVPFGTIEVGDRFRFRLRANPTRKRHIREGEVGENGTPRRPTGPNGTRIPLFADAELRDWIATKGNQHGFRVLGARWQPDAVTGDRQRGRKADGNPVVHYAMVYDGVLEVTDGQVLQEALANGIGPAKAYGFGLLSLAPS